MRGNRLDGAGGVEVFAQINTHIASKHDICPFGKAVARKGGILYTELPAVAGAKEDVRRRLAEVLPAFLAKGVGNEATWVIVMPLTENHAMAKKQAHMVRMNLEFAAEKQMNSRRTDSEIEGLVKERIVATNIIDPKYAQSPLVAYAEYGDHDRALFCFAANPHYNLEHPRYLPNDAIVVTMNADVRSAEDGYPRVMKRMNIASVAGSICPFVNGINYEGLKKYFGDNSGVEVSFANALLIKRLALEVVKAQKPFYLDPITP